jgi:GT2 family glycosyltransferase
VTRNSGETISKSISSIKKIADEIVIVDLGSIDNTISLCRQMGCTVYKYKWDGASSSVENFALSKCRKEYVLKMSPDEILSQDSLSVVKSILYNKSIKKDSFYFDILNTFNDWVANNPDTNLKKNMNSPDIRLFPNVSKISYEGKEYATVYNSLMSIKDVSVKGSGCSLIKNVKNVKNDKNVIVENMENVISKESRIDDRVGCTAIVILVFNAFNFAKECFDHVKKNTKVDYKIYVINNGSNDSRVDDFFSSRSDVNYIKNEENTGVAKGRNQGIQEALKDKENEYICLLDSDTKVSEGWLSSMVRFLSINKDASMVGPITNACTGYQNVVRNSWVGKYDKDKILQMSKTNGKFSETSYLDRFCQVFRRDLINQIGMLDESFGLIGWEELDFCKRIVQSGMQMYISGASYVFHTWHASTRFNSMSYPLVVNKSSKKYHKKWSHKAIQQREVEEKVHSQDCPNTSIIVLTYNNLDINKRFFEEFEKYTSNYELIVIDNGSNDGTVEYLKSLGCIHKLILNSENQGVIKARNTGLRESSHSYLLCIDNDQIVKKDWLIHLHREMLKGYDMVGVEAWEMSSKHLMPKKRHVLKRGGIKIDYIGAGGCLMKRSMLQDIGIFDERFGMAYYEDPDLCFRAREAGYKIGWCHRRIINHLEHKTLIEGQKDFNYNEELSSSHKFFVEKVNNKKKGKIYKECRIDDIVDSETGNVIDSGDIVNDKNLVFAITTYNRINYLKKCIKTWNETRDRKANWTLVIADDGSSKHTLKYIDELNIEGVDVVVIKNRRRGVHHQTNCIIKYLDSVDFDLCFKVDDDVFFKRKGWDSLYYKEICRTGFDHLVLYQNEWLRSDFYKDYGNLISRASIQNVQGAFFTITPKMVEEVGYFDTEQFGFSGLGHIDYTARACVAGFNELSSVFDVKGSNTYIKLQPRETYRPAISMSERNRENTARVINRKRDIIKSRNISFVEYKDINARNKRYKR